MPADKKLKAKIYSILKAEFPEDTVDVTDGYHQNVHILVVSRKFDKFRSEKTRQEYLWNLIERGKLTEEQKSHISLLLPVSPALLK